MQEFLRVNANERTGKIRKGSKSRTIVFFFFQTRSLGSVDDDSWNLLDEREREREGESRNYVVNEGSLNERRKAVRLITNER